MDLENVHGRSTRTAKGRSRNAARMGCAPEPPPRQPRATAGASRGVARPARGMGRGRVSASDAGAVSVLVVSVAPGVPGGKVLANLTLRISSDGFSFLSRPWRVVTGPSG